MTEENQDKWKYLFCRIFVHRDEDVRYYKACVRYGEAQDKKNCTHWFTTVKEKVHRYEEVCHNEGKGLLTRNEFKTSFGFAAVKIVFIVANMLATEMPLFVEAKVK